MKITEVHFDDYVLRPENQNNTNVLRVGGDENAVGISSLVDDLVEDDGGILATKVVVDKATGEKTICRARYPWLMVKTVRYAREIMPVKAEAAKKP